MNEKEIEKIISRNNKIEQNRINQENNLSDKNIIQQTKKLNPFIEIIDSSRLDDNIINLNLNNKETIEINESINNKPNIEINNNIINEEPMTFNPNKNIINNSQMNNKEIQNKNFLTFKNEEESIETDYNHIILNDINSEEQIGQIKFNEENFNINDIIIILKKLIYKMKINLSGNINTKNNNLKFNSIFIDKIKQIKKDIIKIFDNIITEGTCKENNIDFNNINFCDNNKNEFEPKYNELCNKFCLNKKMNEIDEIENIYKTQIINLKNKIDKYEKENNNLKKIIQNSQNIFEDLIYKNKLLSSKLIKYKTLYEEKNKE